MRDRHIAGRIAGAAEAADAEHDRGFLAGLGRFDAAGHVDSAGAAAAADRLGEQAGRAVARGEQVGIDGADDVAAKAAVAAKPADAHDQLARGRDSARNVDSALAAAAADRLDRDRDLVVANALDLDAVGRVDRRADARGNVAGIAAAAAKAADAERRDARLVVARPADRNLAGDVEAALAAAAADRLDDDAVRSAAAGPVGRIDEGNVGNRSGNG